MNQTRERVRYKRGKHRETVTSKVTVYQSRCLNFRIEKFVCKYGLPTYYYAVDATLPERTQLISRHRTRRAAERAVERCARLRRKPCRC